VGIGNKFSDSDVTDILYNQILNVYYRIYNCLYLDDIFSSLGNEKRDYCYSPDISDLIITVLRAYAKHQVLQLYEPGGEKYLESKHQVENM
jgi:hypothetical protein